MDEALFAWRDFYGAVANASAALVGLVFVGLSIRLTRSALPASAKALALVSLANLLYPLYVSLAMLLPTGAPGVQATALLLPAAVCLLELAVAFRLERRAHDVISRPSAVYRYVLPLAASLVLVAGALGLLASAEVALFAPVVFIGVMFVVGSHNAWTLLLTSLEGDR
ncbi:MAG TPA: hypothetical protein VFX65_01535 [Candidatus Limnocylindrales bacterium]|nr:hypothetical protein [Candidatus Limnocylindrales bacterium]